ncbi:hypothetical protein WJX84_004910 [Apatococcus fuscideae]|uniref:Importin N-terminal domain-containing protein n=1 Tax=Apatococcus fuscideae TaxID=2026836 RepID=A0AAW1TAJ5_9CHLO
MDQQLTPDQVFKQVQTIDEASRLSAAVLAKNAVGSSWRKTLGSREWSRVPDEEKQTVRSSALHLLLNEQSSRVAVQLALLVTNISRFDFPSHWPGLLSDLAIACMPDSPVAFSGRERAMLALKHVLRALRSKRIVIETPRPNSGQLSPQGLRPLADRITHERQQINASAESVFMPLRQVWEAGMTALMQREENWEAKAHVAVRALSALKELLLLLPAWDSIKADINRFWGEVHAASEGLYNTFLAGSQANQTGLVALRASQAYERMIQCVMTALDRNPLDFAACIPHFLTLYCDTALVTMDAATVHSIRAKRRVLLTRFLARALLSPFYRQEWLLSPVPDRLPLLQRERAQQGRAQSNAAAAALDNMLSSEPGGRCPQLLGAIITKYVALSPEELEEWRIDPEGYVRGIDVELSPDADSPRPCGLALLLCMLERGDRQVAQALLAMAHQLQAQPVSAERDLAQEACYRAIGEGFMHVAEHFSFSNWYQQELRFLLQAPASRDVSSNALRARALWLIGACGSDLPQPQWEEALQLVAQHMQASDLVVSLTAVAALMPLLTIILEEEQVIRHEKEIQKRQQMTPEAAAAHMQAASLSDQPARSSPEAPDASPVDNAAHDQRLKVLQSSAGTILTSVFKLMQDRLQEVESLVRVLQLVTILVEVLGDGVDPYLPTLTSALPKVWSKTHQQSEGSGESGAVARLHSALIAVLTHLVSRMGSQAASHSEVQGVLFPLLAHATDPSLPESEVLIEEALRLWRAVLGATDQIPFEFVNLMPNLWKILERGRDNAAAYAVIEALLLGGVADMKAVCGKVVFTCMRNSVEAIARSFHDAGSTDSQDEAAPANGYIHSPMAAGIIGRQQATGTQLADATAQEAQAAASLAALMLSLYPDLVPDTSSLEGLSQAVQQGEGSSGDPMITWIQTLRYMAVTIASREMQAHGLSGGVVGVSESFLEALARLLFRQPAALQLLLHGQEPAAESRFVDWWIHLASARYLEEVLGMPAMAALGRLRRRLAAASLCALICAGSCASLREPAQCAHALSLSFVCLSEDSEFQGDQQDIASAAAEERSDRIVKARLQLARTDSLRTLSMSHALQAAAKAAASQCGEQNLLQAVSWLDSRMEQSLRTILHTNASAQPPALPAGLD